jgi:hypothetical protein
VWGYDPGSVALIPPPPSSPSSPPPLPPPPPPHLPLSCAAESQVRGSAVYWRRNTGGVGSQNDKQTPKTPLSQRLGSQLNKPGFNRLRTLNPTVSRGLWCLLVILRIDPLQGPGDVRVGAGELGAGAVSLTLPASSRVTAIQCEDGLAERCARKGLGTGQIGCLFCD